MMQRIRYRSFSTGSFFFLIILHLLVAASTAQAAGDYITLKKYLSARMYTEAWLEMMRCELGNKVEDPKLTKLKKDLLPPTKKEALNRAKVKPDDSMLYTVLADIDFQEGQVDRGIQNISRSIENKPNDLSHYVFAKLLFTKGNIPQSLESMEKALHLNPGSEVLFEDFQFLYNTRAYGLTAAKRLTPDAGFLKRITPIAAKSGPPKPPDSPFDNDPTQTPEPVTPLETEPETGTETDVSDPLALAQTPDAPPKTPTGRQTGVSTGKKSGTSTGVSTGSGTSTSAGTSTGVAAKTGTQTLVTTKPPTEDPYAMPIDDPLGAMGTSTGSESPELPKADDPEQKTIKEAEGFLEHARNKFKDGNFDDAETNIKKALKIFPQILGADELQTKIDEKRTIEKNFKLAVSLYENEKYDLARDGIQKAYDAEQEKYPEATFYLGKIYVLGSNKDEEKARRYFDLFLKNPSANPELKRDVEWVVIGILTDQAQYEEAHRRFNDFVDREPEFAKNQSSYWKLKYRLWYRVYQTEVLVGTAVFCGAFIIVFFLMLIPSFGFFTFDPLKKAHTAFEAKQYDKAVKVVEDALKRKKHPIQIQRQLHEIAVEAHFLLKNYFKCQDHAKELLQLFADNPVAWKFLSKAYVETSDTTNDAITMYETMYRKNPENKDYLPILAKYYASQKLYSVEAMEVMEAFYQLEATNLDNVLALSEAFVQNKRMDEMVLTVLPQALKSKPDHIPFRELLARAYSKAGQFAEASRECLAVLKTNMNNMGIHVVYTSCMKKLNMLDEAVLQYEDFLRKNPGNPQLQEILTGLRKELEGAGGSAGGGSAYSSGGSGRISSGAGGKQGMPSSGGFSGGLDELSPFSEEILTDGLEGLPNIGFSGMETNTADPTDAQVKGFVEPLPDGLDTSKGQVPLPNFLRREGHEETPFPPASSPFSPQPSSQSSSSDTDLHDLPTMDPFSEGLIPMDEELLPPRKPQTDGPKPKAGSFSAGKMGKSETKSPESTSGAGSMSGNTADASKPFRIASVAPETSSKSRSSAPFASEKPSRASPPKSNNYEDDSLNVKVPTVANLPPAGGVGVPLGQTPSAPTIPNELAQARKSASAKKWDDVVGMLVPIFAGSRRKDVGLLLADAYLHQKKPELAQEILETLDFDQEMMSEEIKDVLYRVAVALEEAKHVPEALKIYDIICNVDINYLDAFDRSDRLYASQPKKSKN
ncbi:MAG: hypothetical protein WA705_29830 [Candidatus Ozemobacteraceae bacterium]